MPQYCDNATFLRLHDAGLPLLDVRSPAEFAVGHIPGAINFPLLSDQQRAVVGTAHAQHGPDAALDAALALLGPHLADKVAAARRMLAAQCEILLHCWRGGMRSRAAAWLLETAGWRVRVLKGGYKSYRTHVRATLALPACVLVLGGMTGSGKTEVLHALAARGAQVVDLEGLAGHRGSAFGGVGLPAQGSNEMFENTLATQWACLDRTRPIWVEDEDRRIGNLTVSEAFFPHIACGRLVVIRVPREQRVARLLRLYTTQGGDACPQTPAVQEELVAAVLRLERRLGNENARCCVQAIRDGHYAEAIQSILGYYDRAYEKQLARRRHLCAGSFDLDGDARHMAAVLLSHEPSLCAGAENKKPLPTRQNAGQR